MFKPFKTPAYAVFGLIVDGRAVDVQYSNWENGHPNTGHNCVIVTKTNHWNTAEKCSIQQKYEDSQKYVCQS